MSVRWTDADLRAILAKPAGLTPEQLAERGRKAAATRRARFGSQDVRGLVAERRAEIASMGGKARQSKYRNIPVEIDGHKFPSKKQADYYKQLLFMKAGDAIRGFTCEVTLPLPSGRRFLRIDFMIVEHDGSIRWVDTKGMVTKDWAVKRDEIQHALGIEIETV